MYTWNATKKLQLTWKLCDSKTKCLYVVKYYDLRSFCSTSIQSWLYFEYNYFEKYGGTVSRISKATFHLAGAAIYSPLIRWSKWICVYVEYLCMTEYIGVSRHQIQCKVQVWPNEIIISPNHLLVFPASKSLSKINLGHDLPRKPSRPWVGQLLYGFLSLHAFPHSSDEIWDHVKIFIQSILLENIYSLIIWIHGTNEVLYSIMIDVKLFKDYKEQEPSDENHQLNKSVVSQLSFGTSIYS